MGGVGLPGLLVGPRQSELGGGVVRVDLQCVLEGVDRFRKLLELRVGRSKEVPGVGVVRIDFSDAAERIDGPARVGRILVIEAKVVPGVGIFGIAFGGLFKQRLRLVAALQVEQRHSAIDGRHL